MSIVCRINPLVFHRWRLGLVTRWRFIRNTTYPLDATAGAAEMMTAACKIFTALAAIVWLIKGEAAIASIWMAANCVILALEERPS